MVWLVSRFGFLRWWSLIKAWNLSAIRVSSGVNKFVVEGMVLESVGVSSS